MFKKRAILNRISVIVDLCHLFYINSLQFIEILTAQCAKVLSPDAESLYTARLYKNLFS